MPKLTLDDCVMVNVEFALRDPLCDPATLPTHAALAALSIGVVPKDAYESVAELRQAVNEVYCGMPDARARLTGILGNRCCDDYQRAVYYAVAGRGVAVMFKALEWLEEVLLGRYRLDRQEFKNCRSVMYDLSPYVSEFPQGPIPQREERFELGPAWLLDSEKR